jgi:threonine dehydrogenase-like Zn-dependent dehydrogenase
MAPRQQYSPSQAISLNNDTGTTISQAPDRRRFRSRGYAPIPDLNNKQVYLVYECAGVPGLLQQIIQSAGFGARIVMGGYCMEEERLFVFAAQNKRLTVHFAGGEEPQDMELALRSIADVKIDVTPWIGARIGPDGAAKAMAEMSGPLAPVRTVVDPRRLS